MANARITIQINISFGNVMTPEPFGVEYPTKLDNDKPSIQTQMLESAIVEKYQAMDRLGLANSRMEKIYDIYYLTKPIYLKENSFRKLLHRLLSEEKLSFLTKYQSHSRRLSLKKTGKLNSGRLLLETISDRQVPRHPLIVINRIK